MSGGDQYATIADVIRIVESAEFFSRCHGDWQQRTLRVPREQTPPPAPASAEPAATLSGPRCPHCRERPPCDPRGCPCEHATPCPGSDAEKRAASAEPKCTCPCHDLASPWRHSDGKCLNCPNDRPGHGVAQDAEAAEDDEAWRIAVSQCHTRYNALRCAEDIRALVAKREAAAFRQVVHVYEGSEDKCDVREVLEYARACADAIEREGGKGR